MLLLAALSIALNGHSAVAKAPHWLDQTLAGYAFKYDETHGTIGVSDEKTGYFILREIDCDGAVVDLLLTRDRNMVVAQGYNVPNFKTANQGSQPLTVKPLPSLSTGKGVKIGDSTGQVTSKLGTPSLRHHSGSRRQYVDYVYSWKEPSKESGHAFTETYTFKGGKLIQIDFLREANDLPG